HNRQEGGHTKKRSKACCPRQPTSIGLRGAGQRDEEGAPGSEVVKPVEMRPVAQRFVTTEAMRDVAHRGFSSSHRLRLRTELVPPPKLSMGGRTEGSRPFSLDAQMHPIGVGRQGFHACS